MTWQLIQRADESGHVYAELQWDERPGNTFELHLDVEEAYRRKGVGRGMVQEMEALAKRRGGMALYTFMAADNEMAIMFFRAMGFLLYEAPGFYGAGRGAYLGVKTIGRPR